VNGEPKQRVGEDVRYHKPNKSTNNNNKKKKHCVAQLSLKNFCCCCAFQQQDVAGLFFTSVSAISTACLAVDSVGALLWLALAALFVVVSSDIVLEWWRTGKLLHRPWTELPVFSLGFALSMLNDLKKFF
jgi:hypothetical protein